MWATGALLAAAALPAACAGTVPEPPSTPSAAETTTSPAPTPTPTGTPDDPFPPGPVLGAPGAVEDVLTGIDTPWDLAFLPSGAVLVTLRDTAEVLLVTAEGSGPLTGQGAQDLAASTDVTGEGGLLGIEASPGFATDHLLYLYRSTSSANQVVRAVLEPDGTLGPLQPVLDGIPHASFHDGGRLAFGPDGFLYVTTGDAGVSTSSQDPSSLAGKILRLTPEGGPAPGNPVEGSPVWSLGHRNVQGIGWDEDGRMFASEFGQNTWDELNVIVPGGNYGWPVVEGAGGGAGFVDPVRTWRTADASPSGIAVTPAGVLLAALRGERLWQVPVTGDEIGEPRVALDGYGRLRDVSLGPDGALWVLTSNRDGRGDPRDGDDRLLRLALPEGT
ncbi:sorbosone dehydrogenase family protein [Actinotalea sp.]|uniref:PQQ-dependent sugar dehydrogenase n=1 Tax=Actinotalea sp. TaxID=1872145 RepID=UPI0035674216